MSYAGQLRIASAEIREHLSVLDSDLVRFAWVGAKALDSSTSVLLLARSDGDCKQFVANISYLYACQRLLETFPNQLDIWKLWPKQQTTFGQYHRPGRSSLDVSIKFANGFYVEVANARLKAFPNQSIDGRELSELAEWRTELRRELNEVRPELAEWPAWSVHQQREVLREALNDEIATALRNAGDIERAAMIERLTQRGPRTLEFVANQNDSDLADSEMPNATRNRLFGFLHRWKAKPTEVDLVEFNGKFFCELASPHFEQEFDALLRLVWRSVTLGESFGLPMTATRRLLEMLRRYDVQPADGTKYDVGAELQILQARLKNTAIATHHTVCTDTTVADPAERDRLVDSLPLAHKLAYLSLQFAQIKAGRKLKYAEAWQYLQEYGFDEADALDGYALPMAETYAEYCSKASRAVGERRTNRRHGRTGGSIVKKSDT